MKREVHYAAAAAFAVFSLFIVYLFSFPPVLWFTLKYRLPVSVPHFFGFYGPAFRLAGLCPPYRHLMELEFRMLGLGNLPDLR